MMLCVFLPNSADDTSSVAFIRSWSVRPRCGISALGDEEARHSEVFVI